MDFIKKLIPNVVMGDSKHNLGTEHFSLGVWEIYPFASYKGQDVSVLILQDPSSTFDLARNYLKRLKSFKHPNILKYIADDEPPSESSTPKSFRIYVERIRQVPWIEINKNTLWKEWFTSGLLNAFNFCTQEAKLIHGNILNSVLMAADGGARLSGFEVTAPREESGYLIDIATRKASADWFHPLEDKEGLKRLLAKLMHNTTQNPKAPRLDQINNELMSLPIRTHTEREVFFRRLTEELPSFPRLFIENRLIPTLLPLFIPPNISIDLSKLLIICNDPRALDALIACPEKMVRMMLLDSITHFLNFLDEKAISQIIGSLHDNMPAIRDAALKASVSLFPLMSHKQAQETTRGYLKLCSDEQPSIRTNSLICLGKMDPKNIPRESFVKTLSSISLKDPFISARKMALATVKIHQTIFSPEDIFNFIIPAISPLIMDKSDADIPTQALGLLKSFVKSNAPIEPSVASSLNLSEKTEPSEKKTSPISASKEPEAISITNKHVPEKSESQTSKATGENDSSSASTGRKFRLGATKTLN
jgi:hypothetical protein